ATPWQHVLSLAPHAALPIFLGVERIGTDQMAFAHVASEGAGLGAAKRVSDLADSDQPLVGGDTHVAEVAPGRAEAECLDLADAPGTGGGAGSVHGEHKVSPFGTTERCSVFCYTSP